MKLTMISISFRGRHYTVFVPLKDGKADRRMIDAMIKHLGAEGCCIGFGI